jgi:hypothetical protein
MRFTNKPHVDAAGPAKAGITGKARTPAPGASSARGGNKTGVAVGDMARAAKAGMTGT